MGITKKINFDSVFIFLFLIVFPFGQIIRLSFNFAGFNIPLHPLDLIVGLGALYSIIFQKYKTKTLRFLGIFLVAAVFSFLLSIFYFKSGVIYGLFYLLRIASYSFFLNYVWNFIKNRKGNSILLIHSLLAVSVASAVFGWIQFIMFPDLKPFFVFGWDMHLFRLVGTFLDPTFLGLIIVFGLLISIYEYLNNRDKKYLFIMFFLLLSLAFTYSRASYLAFLGGVAVIGIAQQKFRKIMLLVLTLILIAIALPTARNHSIELTRTFSIAARFNNYKEAFDLFKRFPLFGVGYDNFCIARNTFIGPEPFSSHACSGSDSSLLLILATTGIVGFLIFLNSVLNLFRSIGKGNGKIIVLASIVALFIHSLFSNSLFFPWVMGYMIVLLGINITE